MEKNLAKVKKFNIRNIFCKIKNIIDFKNMKHNFFSRRPVIILFGIIILLKTILSLTFAIIQCLQKISGIICSLFS